MNGASTRSAQFVRNNLELLGFGGRKDALVQAVKELFENALDATGAMSTEQEWGTAAKELLRISIQANKASVGVLDIVCGDTGSGIHAHRIKQLCCSMFETTKRKRGARAAGKYGIGLKAAVLYSQLHDAGGCLKVATTAGSGEILCVNLRINPDSEEPAIVQSVTQFAVDEAHHSFSGTEMRLSVPCPATIAEVEDAADCLAMYFQSLGYTLPPFVSVKFSFDVGEVSTLVELLHNEEPVDRFAAELGVSDGDIKFENQANDRFTASCMGVLMSSQSASEPTAIEICLLRYVNHVPLLNAEDLLICGIACGTSSPSIWKRYGLRCRPTSSHLVDQFVATPVRPGANSSDVASRLIVAVDVCHRGSDASVKFGSMRKTHVDKSYARQVQVCMAALLRQFEESGRLLTPAQRQLEQLSSEFAPLIARAAVGILNTARTPSQPNACVHHVVDEPTVVRQLQRVLHHQTAFSSR